ncbi:hypothetical protein BUALT_Bualt05G0082200 [Buddleja alternifolia]|uniref:BZIP domain-containing protein n=1 Tax=Buddleja alternifolia TaxID=168488 RepID=A0AAV6XU08_9LAMI|nr:hypothetical protein BUALT_Bualt05G0082200 [Buddleja alternifolia]
MDNGQNSDTYRMDGSLVLHLENESMTHPDDILVRRLKNRERQRRYRARKRHEADLRKSSSVDQSTPLHYQQMPAELLSVPVQVDISMNLTPPDCLTRVHCQRDWKKDARRAHIHKKQEIGSIESDTSTPGGSPAPSLDNNVEHRVQSSRRHWKAEARNRKSSEFYVLDKQNPDVCSSFVVQFGGKICRVVEQPA